MSKITKDSGDDIRSRRMGLLRSMRDNDTAETLLLAENFGPNQEYYCIYTQKFYYEPWTFAKMVEFRPFRNIRVFTKLGAEGARKIGYFLQWIGQPSYTHQLYTNGQPCQNYTKNTSALVTYACGTSNRIVDFTAIRKCDYYRLFFETPLACGHSPDSRFDNERAIAKYGKVNWNFMILFIITVAVFVVFSCFILITKKRRLY